MGEKPYKLALMMIVKNESAVIAETLRIISKNFSPDYWVISDTGSTDNTKDVITDTMKELGIPGRFADKAWVDFSTNRNHVLQEATKDAEYIILFDADDGFVGDFKMPELVADMYHMQTKFTDISYYRPLIISSRCKWKWYGVLHEYIDCIDHHPTIVQLSGDYNVIPNRVSGARSEDPHKYFKDGLVFEKALIDETTPKHLISRYTYYTGQSYKDAERMDRAIEFFKKATQLSGWTEEKYMSCMYLGNHYFSNNDIVDALYWYMKAPEFSPHRVEWALAAINCLPDAAGVAKLGILTSISANVIATPSTGNYYLIDTKAHTVYFINNIIHLSCSCGKYDIACEYLYAQSKMKIYLTEKDINSLKINIEFVKNHINNPLINKCLKLLE